MSVFPEWNPLFAPHGGSNVTVMRLLQRQGSPFLLLPNKAAAARHVLDLYPAQRQRARFLRACLRLMTRVGFRVGREVRLDWDASAPLPRYISARTASSKAELGVLFGNPNATGRRLLMLVLRDGNPQFVAKLGIGTQAEELLDREAKCLETLPAHLPGRPSGFERIPGTTGFALSFIAGSTPPWRPPENRLLELLLAWVDRTKEVQLDAVAAWARVRTSSTDSARVRTIESAFGGDPFLSTITHGDFVPWNIRVSGEQWTVLDWERAELLGLPGWDWLHYVIQGQVLVGKRSAELALRTAQETMRGMAFQAYARETRIRGREEAVLKSYLLHACEVVRQTEGAGIMRELLALA